MARMVSCSMVAFCRTLTLRLLDRDHRHVGLQHRAEQVTLGGDLLVDQEQVVLDVTQVGLQIRVRRSALDRGDHAEQRMDGAVEVGGLAAQRVDPLGRRHGAGEHGGLDLVDVVSRARPRPARTRPRPDPGWPTAPRCCPLRAAPAAAPAAAVASAQLARHALPHGDHEGRREEDADLAELDLLGRVVVPGGAQDDQPHVTVVLLDLGPHVKALRVLDRQFVQPEGLTDLVQLLDPRLEQPEPHESVLRAPGRRLLQRDRPLLLPAAVLVVSTINDHRGDSFAACASARSRYTA